MTVFLSSPRVRGSVEACVKLFVLECVGREPSHSVLLSLRLCRQTLKRRPPQRVGVQHRQQQQQLMQRGIHLPTGPGLAVYRKLIYGPRRLDGAGPGGWSQGLVAYARPSRRSLECVYRLSRRRAIASRLSTSHPRAVEQLNLYYRNVRVTYIDGTT